jgi:hypothetical protein
MAPDGSATVATGPSGGGDHRARMTMAVNQPELLQPRLVSRAEIRRLVHGTSAIGDFNSRFAVLITKSVGTMWCAYLFVLISLVSLPDAIKAFQQGDNFVAVSWLSQSFLQLVLLPIIIVGQNVTAAAQDARAEADHETLTALHTINVTQLHILERQQLILDRIARLEEGTPSRSDAPA